jgi:hypothetical protein
MLKNKIVYRNCLQTQAHKFQISHTSRIEHKKPQAKALSTLRGENKKKNFIPKIFNTNRLLELIARTDCSNRLLEPIARTDCSNRLLEPIAQTDCSNKKLN